MRSIASAHFKIAMDKIEHILRGVTTNHTLIFSDCWGMDKEVRMLEIEKSAFSEETWSVVKQMCEFHNPNWSTTCSCQNHRLPPGRGCLPSRLTTGRKSHSEGKRFRSRGSCVNLATHVQWCPLNPSIREASVTLDLPRETWSQAIKPLFLTLARCHLTCQWNLTGVTVNFMCLGG